MSDAFTNFLGGVAGGVFGPTGNLRDYQHANRLYVQNSYARAPKFGFLYFVNFGINKAAIVNPQWGIRGLNDVGFLVKKIDLPKFSITNETINQYNKKTVVQTGIKYNPIAMEFHDDNSDITTGLWTNYYKYYYADSVYGDRNKNSKIPAFNNTKSGTKYGKTDYSYGLNNGQADPFFTDISIYVLHQHRFTKIQLVNPLVTEWSHDNLDQENSTKIMSNKMSVAYENVIYSAGKIKKNNDSGAFTAVYYDNTPSPLSVSGNGSATLFGAGGVIAGADSVFESIAEGNFLGAAIQATTTLRNARNITAASLKTEAYSIAGGVLGTIAATGNQPGGVAAAASAGAQQSGLGVLGTVGINLFNNSSVDRSTPATQANVTQQR
jgi:hypothetical protein